MNRILEILHQKNLRQIVLASKLGVAKSTVSQWCSNKSQPSINYLEQISNVLDCDITELLVSNKNNKK